MKKLCELVQLDVLCLLCVCVSRFFLSLAFRPENRIYSWRRKMNKDTLNGSLVERVELCFFLFKYLTQESAD